MRAILGGLVRFLVVILLTVLLPFLLKAQSNEANSDKNDKSVLDSVGKVAKETTEQFSKTLGETRQLRDGAEYFVLANYSPLDLLIPSKYGFTFGYILNADKTWEFEYLRGSLSVPFIIEDLGKMTEKRYSLIGRSYFGGNSFNLSYGLSYFDFSLVLGDKLLSRLTGGGYPSIDLVEVQSLGLNIAIGNRWSFNRNIVFGIDWISWAQPFYTTKKNSYFLDYASNQQDKDDVDKAVKFISYFPRLAFLKIQLGISF